MIDMAAMRRPYAVAVDLIDAVLKDVFGPG